MLFRGKNFWLYCISSTDGGHTACVAGVDGPLTSYRIHTIQVSLRSKHFLDTLDRTGVPLFG